MWRETAVPYFKVERSSFCLEDWKRLENTCRELNQGLSQYVRDNGLRRYAFFFNGSTAPLGPDLCFFSFTIISQIVGLLGRGISSSQGLYLNTGKQKQNKHIHTPNIHALSGIRTHDPSVRTSEDSSCLDRSATLTGRYPYAYNKF
jgi:hypothetical protein